MLFTDGPEIRVYDPADELYSDVIFHEGRIDAMDYDNVTCKYDLMKYREVEHQWTNPPRLLSLRLISRHVALRKWCPMRHSTWENFLTLFTYDCNQFVMYYGNK